MKTRLTLKVLPGARKTGFSGHHGDAWKLRISAPPVDGKANEAIIRFLAKLAAVPTGAVRIVSGFTSSTKIVELDGIDSAHLERAILESHGHSTHTGSASSPKA